MKKFFSLILLIIIVVGMIYTIHQIPFGKNQSKIGKYFVANGKDETGAANIVTSVVVGYRSFDTLGEVTVLFLAAIGLGAILTTTKKQNHDIEKASLILNTGCRFLFPLVLLFSAYIFIHGHLSPGGGFQGGAVVASGFLLIYLACPGKRINKVGNTISESVGGLIFIILGAIGLFVGDRYFLANFLPKGELNTLFSAGIIPIIYIALGFKVGSELNSVIDKMMEES